MPLREGCSQDIIQANISQLIEEGYPPDQAAAIAYSQCKNAYTPDEWKTILEGIGYGKSLGFRTRKGGPSGTFIKAIGVDNPDRFEAHLVRYAKSPDDTDLDDEWFDGSTWFKFDDGYPVIGRPVNYQHALDPEYGSFSLGIFDKQNEDDIGVFVEAQLHSRARYMDMLRELGRRKGIHLGESQLKEKAEIGVTVNRELITQVPLQMSMGADPAVYAVNEKNGHIDTCGIIHGALTPTPADDKQPLVRFKSAMQYVTDLQNDRKTVIIGNVRTAKAEQPGKTSATTAILESATETQTPDNPVLSTEVGVDLSRFATILTDNLKSNINGEELSLMDREELLGKIRKQLEPVVDELLEQLGVEPEKQEDEEELLDEMLGKAEGDLPEDEEEIKQLEEEDVVELIRENAKNWLPEQIKQVLKENANVTAQSKATASNILEAYKASIPAQSYKKQKGGYRQSEGNPQQPPAPLVSVEEEMRYAGLSAEEMALGLRIAHQKFFAHRKPGTVKLQEYVDSGLLSDAFIRSMAFKATDAVKAAGQYKPRGPKDRAMASDYHIMKSAMPWKADEQNAVAITNQGAEWAFIFYDTRLWERARYETLLFDKMIARGMRTVDVTGKTMNVKIDTGSPTVYTAPEGQSLDATGRPEIVVQTTPFTTDEVEKNAKKHMLATSHTDELDEDSIINIMTYLDNDAVIAMAESLESVFINGDTTATAANINTTSVPATGIQTPDYIAWDGIRHQYLVDHTARGNAKGAALEITDFEDTLKLLDAQFRTGQKRKDMCLFIVDDSTESATRTLPEVLTKDVAGIDATAFAGTIPPLFGVEVYPSGFLALSLATGFIHATVGNNYGSIACVYAPYWQYGRKRQVTVELERYAQSSATVVVVSVRHILAARGDNAASGTFDITV